MAVLDQIGTTLATGAETITGSYIVQRREVSNFDVVSEDIDDENGALKTRLITKRHEKTRLELVLIDGALPATDFPVGNIAVHTDYTEWYVDSMVLTKAGTAHRASVEMTKLGIT